MQVSQHSSSRFGEDIEILNKNRIIQPLLYGEDLQVMRKDSEEEKTEFNENTSFSGTRKGIFI